MPTPPKHRTNDTCPAYIASEYDRNMYYCPNDNQYFYRGHSIQVDEQGTWTTTHWLLVIERKSPHSICNAIDIAIRKDEEAKRAKEGLNEERKESLKVYFAKSSNGQSSQVVASKATPERMSIKVSDLRRKTTKHGRR